MKELGEAIRVIFAKIGDFFDILDLSFLISGAAASGALWFLTYHYHLAWPVMLSGTSLLVSLFFICYLSGLICFALGRWLRGLLLGSQKGFVTIFRAVLEAHGLDEFPLYKPYLERNPRGLHSLYVRLWAELRETPELAPSMALCKRYWVMAATYDGVAFALLIWMGSIILWKSGLLPDAPPTHQAFGLMLLVMGFALYGCLREAARYKLNQIEELVATLAMHHDREGSTLQGEH